MIKKTFKFIGYFVGALNMGVASSIFPLFLAPLFAIFGTDNGVGAPMGVSAGICAVLAAVMYAMHYVRRKKEHDSPDYRATAAILGFVLGAVAAIVIVVSVLGSGELGNITGY